MYLNGSRLKAPGIKPESTQYFVHSATRRHHEWLALTIHEFHPPTPNDSCLWASCLPRDNRPTFRLTSWRSVRKGNQVQCIHAGRKFLAGCPSELVARCCAHVFSSGSAAYSGEVAATRLVGCVMPDRFVLRFLRCHATRGHHARQRPRIWCPWLGTACLLGQCRRCRQFACRRIHPRACRRYIAALSATLYQPSRARLNRVAGSFQLPVPKPMPLI
jgi:hypothetical protein